jgi:hypothetical protein
MASKPGPLKVDLAQFASVEDAVRKAEASFARFVPLAKRIVAADQGSLHEPAILMLSAIARATGLCVGIVHAVETENPHAAFPLIRSYADVVLVALFVHLRPAYLQTALRGPRNLKAGDMKPRTSQAMISAVSERAPGFAAAWDELSDLTHFGSLAIWNAWQLDTSAPAPNTLGTFNFATHPRWRNASDPLLVCGWLIELSDALTDTLELMLGDWFPEAPQDPPKNDTNKEDEA